MDANEFRIDFLEEIKVSAAVTGDGTCATFVSTFANYLQEGEFLPDFQPVILKVLVSITGNYVLMVMHMMNSRKQ